MRGVVAHYERDLILQVKVQAILKAGGFDALVCPTPDRLPHTVRPAAAVVGLHAPGWAEAAASFVKRGIPVVGYCGHAEVALRQQARSAGVSRVLPNSELEHGLVPALEYIISFSPVGADEQDGVSTP